MDTDDILKLLLIALFLLPGLFAKKKKKTENYHDSDTGQYEYKDPFKDFESFDSEEYFPQETFEKPQVTQQIQFDSIDTIPQEEGSSVFTKEQIEAALASIAKQESKKDEIFQDEINGNENTANINTGNEFLNDFDARQALIYSEIINPKYLNV